MNRLFQIRARKKQYFQVQNRTTETKNERFIEGIYLYHFFINTK